MTVQRKFDPIAPNMLWVADFTYVSTWSGWMYVAFVIDAFSRRILGWRTSTAMTTPLVLDAVEHLVHHNDRGAQYTSIAFTDRLVEAGIDASVGTTGDSYDNALAETINGLYKTELIKLQGPWRTVGSEIAAAASGLRGMCERRRRDRHPTAAPATAAEWVDLAHRLPWSSRPAKAEAPGPRVGAR